MLVRKLLLAVSMAAFAGCGGDDSRDSGDNTTNPISEPALPPGSEFGPQEAPGWVLQESGGIAPINVISAVDSTRAWTGDQTVTSPEVIEGGLRRTQDGGATWNFLCQTPENQSHTVVHAPTVLQIQFLTAQSGFALTRYSLLATADGGTTWETRQNSLATTNVDMSFIDPSTGWLTSDKSGGLRKTSDGGATWTYQSVDGNDSTAAGRAVQFAGALNGWVALRTGADGETIFKTTDGGFTWVPSFFIAGDYDSLWVRDIATFGPNKAWVVASTLDESTPGGDVIWATADGGGTWTAQSSDGSGGFRGIHFVDHLNGWAVGRKIHRTTDGGATWTVQPTAQEGFRDVVFVSPTTGWVVGQNGVILKTTTKGEE